jgi:putative flippase GtrA
VKILRAASRHSAVRFLIVGGLTFVVDVGLLAVLHEIAGVPLPVATGVAFLASFAFNFAAQRFFAFRGTGSILVGLGKYTGLVFVNTLATIGIVGVSEALGWGWLPGKLVAVGAITVWNYFLYRYWIFASTRPDQNSTITSSHSAAAISPDNVDG